MAVFFSFLLTIGLQIIYSAGGSFGYCFVILIFSILLITSEHVTKSAILLEVFLNRMTKFSMNFIPLVQEI